MTLTVENIGPGPRRLPALSLCHYGEQNGDAMRDPEMCFEMVIEDGRLKRFDPYYYRNDYVGRRSSRTTRTTGCQRPDRPEAEGLCRLLGPEPEGARLLAWVSRTTI